MKKTFLLILAILLIIIFIVLGSILKIRSKQTQAKKYNQEYEYYLNKELYGTEVATLINKVVEQNEKNNVQKDKNGYYIDNGINSIKINLNMITIKKTYPMELIYNNSTQNFVKNFNIILFKCSNIEYHKKTGKVSTITFEQLEK